MVAPVYLPTVVAGSATIASIIYLNNVGLKRTAAATALYAVSERAFDDYKEKVIEKFGDQQHVAVQDEVAQDQVTKNPPVDKEVIITGNGDVMCYDSITGRYFRSTVEKLRRSENELNKQILDEMYATLSDFYYLIGLPPTDYSDGVGWNTDKMMSLNFSTTMAEDDTPCISILYNVLPTPEYIR